EGCEFMEGAEEQLVGEERVGRKEREGQFVRDDGTDQYPVVLLDCCPKPRPLLTVLPPLLPVRVPVHIVSVRLDFLSHDRQKIWAGCFNLIECPVAEVNGIAVVSV